ncbi:MAG: hypothetical protein ACT4P7_12220 [Gemmatimonadaceae bacterium]
MLLEVREVGRKTPRDGRLEITETTYRRLLMHGETLTVTVGERRAEGALERMPCSCGRAPGASHEHLFIRSELLRELQPGETCALELTASGELSVARPHPLAP